MGFLKRLFNRDNSIDVLELLAAQHAEVDTLIERIENGHGDRRELLLELADALAAHATIEEKLFYPYVMQRATSEMLHEAVEEHLAIKRTLADLITMRLDDESFHGKLTVLREQVAHHAHEEEEGELFPKVKTLLSEEERAGLGNEMLAMFEELLATSPHKDVPAETAAAAQLPASSR